MSIGSLVFLALLGMIGAWTGGADIIKPTIRVTFWGAFAMGLTAAIGALVGQGGLTPSAGAHSPARMCQRT